MYSCRVEVLCSGSTWLWSHSDILFQRWSKDFTIFFEQSMFSVITAPAECKTCSAGHDNKAFIHAQSHIKLPREHKELWSVLTGSLAMSEETRACLVQACNYHFCLLLRTPPNHPPQTWKTPNYRRVLVKCLQRRL